MHQRKVGWWVPALALASLVACAGGEPPEAPVSEFMWPAGDAEMGRAAFAALRCHSCHEVDSDPSMPAPVSANRGPAIGGLQDRMSRDKIAMEIFSPSHDVPPPRDSSMSPMGDFRETMTVQQMIDLITFIDTAGDG